MSKWSCLLEIFEKKKKKKKKLMIFTKKMNLTNFWVKKNKIKMALLSICYEARSQNVKQIILFKFS